MSHRNLRHRSSHLLTTITLMTSIITAYAATTSVGMIRSESSVSAENSIENKDAVEGETIKLACRYDPSVRSEGKELAFYWQKTNARGLQDVVAINANSLSTDYVLESSDGKYDLMIITAQYDRDNGQFECKIKEAGSGIAVQSKAYVVTILLPPGPPQITTSSIVAKEGESFRLTCASAGGSPDPVIQWFKDNVPVQGQVVRGGSRDKPTSNVLDIKPTIADDRSFYKCTVWNRAIREDQKSSATYSLDVHYVPRVRVGPFSPLNVLRGADAFMTCSVDANPSATKIRWYKNDRLISHELNHTVVNVVPNDSGTFVCVADNGVTDSNGRSGRGELELSVQFAPIVTVVGEKEVTAGDSVSIACKVTANPAAHTIIWTRENDPSFRQSGDLLRIERISPNDAGRYVCTASNSLKPSGSLNSFEQSSNASIMIRVRHAPGNTQIAPLNPVAISGKPFSLSCGSSPPGWPRTEYRWWREGNDKQDLSRSTNLTFNAMHVSQEGRYYCQPFNSLGKGTIGSVFLTVNEAPSVTFAMPHSQVRRTTDRIFSLTCRSRGKPKPAVTWFHNGSPLTTDGRFRIETRESLEDANVYVLTTQLHFELQDKRTNAAAALDAGRYACVFDNEIGVPARAETSLRVEHSPIVRHSYNKVAFDVGENASLQCKMSAYPEPRFEWSFNGKLIEGSRRYSVNVTTQVTDTEEIFVGNLMIRDVRPDDYGHYLCRSWNAIGDDDEKTNIQLVRKSAPDAPTQVEAIEIMSDSVTLRWKESFNGGYSNTEFVISYSPDGDKWKNESCRTTNPCRVTGLESRSDYLFKVLAINAGGHSGFSEEITVTTKINLKDMPNAYDAFFDSVRNALTFRVEATSLRLVAKIEVRETDHPEWTGLTVVPIVTDLEEIFLKPSNNGFSDMRIMLCLQSNDSWCGFEHLVKMDGSGVGSNSTYLREAKGYSLEHIFNVLLVAFLLAVAIAVLFLLGCCCRKRLGLQDKKKNSSVSSKSTPSGNSFESGSDDEAAKVVNSMQQAYYVPHDNEVLMNGDGMMHDPSKLSSLPIYATTGPRSAHLVPQNYYLTGDGNDASPGGSNETTHSDLWMLKPDGSGAVVDGSEVPVSYHALYGTHSGHGVGADAGTPAYPYTYYTHEEYPIGDDAINLKNSLYSPYYDDSPVVYGSSQQQLQPMTSAVPHHHRHDSQHHDPNDASHADDEYSSNGRSGRVIREIIV